VRFPFTELVDTERIDWRCLWFSESLDEDGNLMRLTGAESTLMDGVERERRLSAAKGEAFESVSEVRLDRWLV
jgi:hypothetical protein